MAQSKARASVKQLALKGDVKSARILAKEVVRSEKQKQKLHTSKARLGSIGIQLSHQLGMILYCAELRVCSPSPLSSDGQSHGVAPEVHGNHEAQ